MSPNSEEVRAALQRQVRTSKTPGLQYVVVDRTGVLLEQCVGLADIASRRPMVPATTLMSYSMSKTITAAAALQLVDTKKLALDDPIARYLDRQPYGPAVTVRHLLAHTSGIPNPIPLRWVHPAADHAMFDEHRALDIVLRQHPRLMFKPGTRFAYSNIGYWLLGRIIERASGDRFTSYVTAHVIRLLDLSPRELAYTVADSGVHASGYLEKYSFMNLIKTFVIDRALIGGYEGAWLRIRDHYPNGPAFGGLVGSVAGFARFLQDQLGERSRVLSDKARALFFDQQRTTDGVAIPMTLGLHMGSRGAAQYLYKEGGGGGFHSMMRLYPEAGIGAVLMVNTTNFNVGALLDEVDARWLG